MIYVAVSTWAMSGMQPKYEPCSIRQCHVNRVNPCWLHEYSAALRTCSCHFLSASRPTCANTQHKEMWENERSTSNAAMPLTPLTIGLSFWPTIRENPRSIILYSNWFSRRRRTRLLPPKCFLTAWDGGWLAKLVPMVDKNKTPHDMSSFITATSSLYPDSTLDPHEEAETCNRIPHQLWCVGWNIQQIQSDHHNECIPVAKKLIVSASQQIWYIQICLGYWGYWRSNWC